MDLVDKSDLTEDNVVDHTQELFDDDDENHRVRLKSQLDVSKLVNGTDGVILEPEFDEQWANAGGDAPGVNYFDTSEKIEDLVKNLRQTFEVASDEEEEDDSFDAKSLHMVNLTPDGGVKKKLRRPGLESAGDVPDHATVTIHYHMFLEGQDEPYDSSRYRGRAERFKLDDGRLLPGLEIAIKSMKKKEEADFLINPGYAFGSMGCPPRIPPDAQIYAKVELIDFVQEGLAEALLAMDPEERNKKKSFDEIEKAAIREHIDGNGYVQQKEWKLAVRRYEKGCKLLEEADLRDDADEKRQKRILLKLYLNRAHCYLKIHWPKKACIALKEAIQIDGKNPKAYYRMARAKRMLRNYDDARKYLMKAQKLAPQDQDIGQELVSLDKEMRAEREAEVAYCQRMFPGAQVPKQRNVEINIDDESYADIVEQLTSFKDDSDRSEMILPSSLTAAEVETARYCANRVGLDLVQVKIGTKNQWKIIKN